MRKIKNNLFFILIILIIGIGLQPVSALSINSQKTIQKGETLKITGNSDSSKVTLEIFAEDWLLEETEVQTDKNNFYSFDYNIGFTAPSGKWRIVAIAGDDKNTAYSWVKNSNESAFIFIKFFSPSKQEFTATEKISFNLKATDSGSPVERGTVFVWFPFQEKKILNETGKGIYSADFEISPVVQPGDYNVIITVEKSTGKKTKFGGENKIKITIARPDIGINIVKPALFETKAAKPVEILVTVNYSTGAILSDAEIIAEINGRKSPLEKTPEGFKMVYIPGENETDYTNITIFAYDSFGNSGKKEILLKIVGLEENFWQKNWLIILVICMLIAGAGYSFFRFFKKRNASSQIAQKRKDIETKMKKVEESFYKRPTVDRKTFNEALSKYREELNELKGKD